jgi:hypothetical protein
VDSKGPARARTKAHDKRDRIVTATGAHFAASQGRGESDEGEWLARLTFPSYSRRESTSGAMYAGVPTVDLGFECSSDDCNHKDHGGEERRQCVRDDQ